jgi:hypothetical protein
VGQVETETEMSVVSAVAMRTRPWVVEVVEVVEVVLGYRVHKPVIPLHVAPLAMVVVPGVPGVITILGLVVVQEVAQVQAVVVVVVVTTALQVIMAVAEMSGRLVWVPVEVVEVLEIMKKDVQAVYTAVVVVGEKSPAPLNLPMVPTASSSSDILPLPFRSISAGMRMAELWILPLRLYLPRI